ncbi:MAG: hypothetical protein Q8S53_01400, partial [Brevundimonas sp.]|uniref:hypothetical protein n=1 Tax=Brevundimonas sp. TaxID=1871086 RepID=UPI0027330757
WFSLVAVPVTSFYFVPHHIATFIYSDRAPLVEIISNFRYNSWDRLSIATALPLSAIIMRLFHFDGMAYFSPIVVVFVALGIIDNVRLSKIRNRLERQ